MMPQLIPDRRPSTAGFVDRLELFFGDSNPIEARVYARLQIGGGHFLGDPAKGQTEGLILSGRIVGPECVIAQTLSSRFQFSNHSTAETLLAETAIPDPCFWTPELPFLYRAELELRRGDQIVEKCERTIGIRRLGVRDRFLYFEGKRFVLRGVHFDKANVLPPPAGLNLQLEASADFLRETWTTIVMCSPTDQLRQFASRRGMLLVANLTISTADCGEDVTVKDLRRLAQWPAVGIAALAPAVKLPHDIQSCIPNLLLAQWYSSQMPLELAPWAQLAFVDVLDLTEFACKTSACSVPIVAVRRLPQQFGIEQARIACDVLQRDLAPYGDYAGYVV